MEPENIKVMIEKSAKFEHIQKHLWNMVRHGSTFQSTIAAALIRELDIKSPEGDCPDSA